jgi:hypothetical protein
VQVKALETAINCLLCSFVMRSMLCPSPKLKTLLAKHYTKRRRANCRRVKHQFSHIIICENWELIRCSGGWVG